jgi:hypothetical protein
LEFIDFRPDDISNIRNARWGGFVTSVTVAGMGLWSSSRVAHGVDTPCRHPQERMYF